MNYVITPQNIIFTLNGEPHLINKGDRLYKEVKDAIENEEPEYILEFLLSSMDVEKIKKVIMDPINNQDVKIEKE